MKIKQETITSCPPGTEKSYIYSETFFDIAGNIIEIREYKRGKIEVWEKYKFDQQNKMTEKLVGTGNSYKPEDYEFKSIFFKGLGDKEVEEINEKGQRVISTFYYNGGIKSRKFYDEKNLCIEENEFQKGSLSKRVLYNHLGQLLEVRNFRVDGVPLNYTINTYNDNTQLLRSKSVSRNNHIKYDKVFKYDADGLLIEEIDHPVDPDIPSGYSSKYFYNSQKLKDSKNLYLCGELIMVYHYKYVFW